VIPGGEIARRVAFFAALGVLQDIVILVRRISSSSASASQSVRVKAGFAFVIGLFMV